MITLRLDELATITGGRLDPDDPATAGTTIDAVATDSRDLPAGAPLFVALPGERADGHDHAAAAVRDGAVAVLAQRPLPDVAAPTVVVPDTWLAVRHLAVAVRERCAPTAVAITGSVGKTTVKDLAAAAIGAGRAVHAARGSFNNELGVPLTLLGLTADHDVLVAEIGARHVGDIADLAPMVAPDVAIVTAVAAVHLEIFGSVEAIGRAKRELVESLGPDGTAVLNADDPTVAAMAASAPHVIGVSLDDPTADVYAEDIRLDRWARPSAVAVTPWGRTELSVPVAGRHQLHNGLFALAAAGHLGVDPARAAAAIAGASVSRWRGEVVDLDGVVVVDDAYNANPTAVGAALETLVAIERTGTTVAVLGEMGEIGPTAAEEHRGVGRRCGELGVERVVVVGAGASAIAIGAREAGVDDVVEVAGPDAAVEELARRVAPGDVVLVKASRAAGLDAVTSGLRARRPAAGGAGQVRR